MPGPIDEVDMWGMEETRNEPPPAEVVDAVLDMQEVQIDYPEVYKEALELKRKRETERR